MDLVAERRRQVETLQKAQAERLAQQEARGQQLIQKMRSSMGKDAARLLQEMETTSEQDAASTTNLVKEVRARILTPAAPSLLDASPLLSRAQLAIQPLAAAWVTPYYATLHGSNGAVYWQGYNPGTLTLWDSASGAGSGIFGTGAASFTVYLDWWFVFKTDVSRYYSQNIYVPYNGFYIVQADDGWFDSKEAHIRIDTSAMGYQYNGKPTASTNTLDVDNQNINVNDRFDGWRNTYYSDLLGGGDNAYLLVSTSFYVYARGGGSFAELNFADGTANHIGTPYVYVS